MKIAKLAAVLLVSALPFAASAHPRPKKAEAPKASGFSVPTIPGKVVGNVGFFSDYAFRGISQTQEKPALQGTLEYNHDSGIYLGAWGSNVDFNDGDEATLEIDWYGGYRTEIKGVKADLGFIYYNYPHASSNRDYDYFEPQISLGYDWGFATTTASLNYSNNFFGDSGDAFYPKLAIAAPLKYGFTVDGYVARQYVDDNVKFGLPDYNTWGLGLTKNLLGLDWKAQYVDTNISEARCDLCDERAIFSVTKSF